MFSSNGYSDIHPDQIRARKEHYHRYTQARSASPVVRRGIDCTELESMGAHFNLPSKQEFWPKVIDDFTDDEAAPRGSSSTPKFLDITHDQRFDRNGSRSSGLPTTRTCTPIKCGPFLPLLELDEFWRQRANNETSANRTGQPYEASPTTRQSPSLCTTIDLDAHDANFPETRRQVYVALSTSHTPSHRSMGTVEEDIRSVKDEPGEPGPWSSYDRKSGGSVV
ncbi:hypothetical protein EJ02DRAFT_421881 [Clathrospora elynae]|uniref:Uncharacterized protein n=1 Tax=Clathrospora elynae TaxID=706981 RepID=A0A6A5SVW4_9PLEO|nr:hypothetical protein EJ02DRAFT_421881 [Clathrospora elynae]